MFKTKVMGIINVTPDSFFEKSRAMVLNDAIATAIRMKAEGADILDIGGESSRPGATMVDEPEELRRVIPVIEGIKKNVDIAISIDTRKPVVARAAVEAGAVLLNDITGFEDKEMVAIAKDGDLEICVMHMQGTPQTMQLNPYYEKGIIAHLLQWFQKKTNMLLNVGIKKEKIIIDPGIGFGKTVADNLEIIHNLPELKGLGFQVLLGGSRKWFLSKILNKPTEELLSATLAMHSFAVAAHVDIIRVHDVKEHRDLVDTITAYQDAVKNRDLGIKSRL